MTASNDDTPRSEPAVEVLSEVAAPNEETKDGMEPVKVEIVVLNPDDEIIDVPEEDHPAAVDANISAEIMGDDGTNAEKEDTQTKEETINAAEPDTENKTDSSEQDTSDKTISTEDKTNTAEPDDQTISKEEDKTNSAEPDNKTISTEEDKTTSEESDTEGQTNPTVTEDEKYSAEAAQEGTDVKTDATLPFTESEDIQPNVSDAGPDADETTEAEENIDASTVTKDESMVTKAADVTTNEAVGSETDVEGDAAASAVTTEVVDTAAECAAEESTAEIVADTQAVSGAGAGAAAVEDEVPAPISVVEAGHSRAEAMAEVAPPAGAGPPMGVAEMKRMAAEDEGPYDSVDVIGDLVDKENQELARRRREQEARCPAPDVIKADM